MSRYLPDPSVPVSPWAPEVLAAVREAKSPMYAVAYPSPGGDWQVSVLKGWDADVLDGFRAGGEWPAGVARELRRRGYVALASLTRTEWDALPDGGRGSATFYDGPEDEGW